MVTLDKILGQAKPLRAIDKIIGQSKRGQAILFIGRPGTGKFALANYLAARFLCQHDNSACSDCQSCRGIAKNNHPDFLLVFPFPNLASEAKKHTLFHFCDPVASDARYSDGTLEEVNRFLTEKADDPYRMVGFKKKGNIPVAVIKDLIRAIGKRPMFGQRRAIVICDIEQMAYGAADLFLKTVEEPPEDSLIILTTSQPHVLLPTLLSRTKRITLSPVNDQIIRKYLESHEVTEGLDFYVKYSGGSPGEALKACEDDLLAVRKDIWEIVSAYVSGQGLPFIIELLRLRYQWASNFEDIRRDFAILEKILRDIYIAKLGLDNGLINIDIRKEITDCAKTAPQPEVMRRWFTILGSASRVNRINNVAADTAFIGAFIEFDRAAAQYR
jgi:DNA polymerase III delta prime subunit